MARRRKIEPKVTKKDHGMKQRKLGLKKEKEKVKYWSGVIAEVEAVQIERIEDMGSNSNREDLLLKCHQLRGVNIKWAQLNAMIQNYIDGMLGFLVADEDKGS